MQELINLLKLHEGFVSHCYDCSEGYKTIGFGRLIDKKLGGGITEEEAEYLLKNDVDKSVIVLQNKLNFFSDLSEVRKTVLIDMYFNMGNRLFKFEKTLEHIKNENFTKASEEMLNSRWAGQVGQRAVRLSKMMESDEYPF